MNTKVENSTNAATIDGLQYVSNIFDIFNISDNSEEIPKLSVNEYVAKTKKILIKIDHAISKNWKNRSIKKEEFPSEEECDKCETGCKICIDNKEFDCTPDNEAGDCFIRFFDAENFASEMEIILFEDNSNFYELLTSEIKSDL